MKSTISQSLDTAGGKKNDQSGVLSKVPDDCKENFSSFAMDPDLIEKIKESVNVPIPNKDPFWKIEGQKNSAKTGQKILGLIKKRSLSEEEITDLRKLAIQSPGNTRTKIQKLKKQYPTNAGLLLLSAICSYGMLLNSSNQSEVLKGLKHATKEAATALMSDEVSLYNCEQFFRIYFAFLDRFKREQIKTHNKLNHDPRLDSSRRELLNAINITEQLLIDKSKLENTLNHLKKKLKSSKYISNFDHMLIKKASNHIVNGNPKEKCELGTAIETIAFVHALTASFARIPILFPLVDMILSNLPDTNKSFFLRIISIKSSRNFLMFRIASAEGDREKMARLGKTLLKENMEGMQKMENQPLYQPFEADSFFNLAFVAQLTAGLYANQDYGKILEMAIEAMDTIIKYDNSNNHVFTEPATRLSRKLYTLRDSGELAETA